MIRAQRRLLHGTQKGFLKHGRSGSFSESKSRLKGVIESTGDEAEDWIENDEKDIERIYQLLR